MTLMIGIDSFDSRALRFTDCYGQRFMKAGRYRYHALAAGAQLVNDERPFTVKVTERTAKDTKMNQRTVRLDWDGKRFTPDAPEVEVEAGDLVLWHCPQQAAPAYGVIGDKEFFASSALASECGYSHAFGVQGTYEWVDALGGEIGGTVVVTDPPVDSNRKMASWKASLTKGALVMIADGKAKPSKVEIMTGQTVYFAVLKGPVTVTSRGLRADGAS